MGEGKCEWARVRGKIKGVRAKGRREGGLCNCVRVGVLAQANIK